MRIRSGDIIKLGPHRLMCGDAGNPKHVAKLFRGRDAPDLVFTSPPYMQQRTYDTVMVIRCWDSMMRRVFGAMPWHDTTQVLVNLGMVHRRGEWLPYWDPWIEWMREAQGWRRYGLYVWDKVSALPGAFNGRLAPSYGFVFHFNKHAVAVRKTEPCKYHGKDSFRGTTNQGNKAWCHRGQVESRAINPFKIRRDVVAMVSRDRTGHPASFPVGLPTAMHASYSDPGSLVFDPFCGSGTSIIAADLGGRIGMGMEISPRYCALAVERYEAHRQRQADNRSVS